MDGLKDRTLATLSGGERRRCAISQALAQHAPVLILDEPVTSLDIGHQQELLELLSWLQVEENLTVVSTSHELTLTGQFADKMLLLSNGLVAAQGKPDEVLTTDLISRHYAAAVAINRDDEGRISVNPVRRI